jgi:hypothetical protein
MILIIGSREARKTRMNLKTMDDLKAGNEESVPGE